MVGRDSNEAGLSRAAALLLGGRAQPHQVLPGLVRAHAVGRVLEDPLIGGDGLGGRAGRGMPREQLLELLLRARPRLGRRLRALGGVHAGHHLGVDGGDAPLLAVVPVPAAGGGREDDEHEGAGGDERAHRRQREGHARACCGAPGAGSSQISPLTLAPAAAVKLPLLTVPVSAPVDRTSTHVSAERLPRTTPPMTMACAVMLASTRPSGPTCSVPSSTMSPSNWPRSVSVPSPRSSPLIVTPVPIVVGEACAPWTATPPPRPPPRPKNASRRLIATARLSDIAGRSAGSASSPRRRAR